MKRSTRQRKIGGHLAPHCAQEEAKILPTTPTHKENKKAILPALSQKLFTWPRARDLNFFSIKFFFILKSIAQTQILFSFPLQEAQGTMDRKTIV
jgi:hypothetical protein